MYIQLYIIYNIHTCDDNTDDKSNSTDKYELRIEGEPLIRLHFPLWGLRLEALNRKASVLKLDLKPQTLERKKDAKL